MVLGGYHDKVVQNARADGCGTGGMGMGLAERDEDEDEDEAGGVHRAIGLGGFRGRIAGWLGIILCLPTYLGTVEKVDGWWVTMIHETISGVG